MKGGGGMFSRQDNSTIYNSEGHPIVIPDDIIYIKTSWIRGEPKYQSVTISHDYLDGNFADSYVGVKLSNYWNYNCCSKNSCYGGYDIQNVRNVRGYASVSSDNRNKMENKNYKKVSMSSMVNTIQILNRYYFPNKKDRDYTNNNLCKIQNKNHGYTS